MKSFAIASAVFMLFAATASAGDLAVSASTLEGMGLAGMQQLSDHDGLAVRGMGLFDNLGVGGIFGGDFGLPTDGFGDIGIPSQFQFGHALGISLGNAIGDLGLPADLGIPSDLGLGGLLGGLNF